MLIYSFRLCGLLLFLLIHLSPVMPSYHLALERTGTFGNLKAGIRVKEKDFLKTLAHCKATTWLATPQILSPDPCWLGCSVLNTNGKLNKCFSQFSPPVLAQCLTDRSSKNMHRQVNQASLKGPFDPQGTQQASQCLLSCPPQ